jgi:hypothetical protein
MKFTPTLLIVIFVFLTFLSWGQNSDRTLVRIDSICSSIDNNKNLFEGIAEGTVTNKRGKTIGGYETRDLKDHNSLYRLTYSMSTDKTYTTIYYYADKTLIKAFTTIEKWDVNHLSPMYSATYYFDNNHVIKVVGENREYSNADYLLNEGNKFLTDFYKTKNEN